MFLTGFCLLGSVDWRRDESRGSTLGLREETRSNNCSGTTNSFWARSRLKPLFNLWVVYKGHETMVHISFMYMSEPPLSQLRLILCLVSRLHLSIRRHGGTPELHVGLYTDLTSQWRDEGALNADTPQNGYKRGPRR